MFMPTVSRPVARRSLQLRWAVLQALVAQYVIGWSAYTRRDPSTYDKAWSTESKHDEARSRTDCWCDTKKGTKYFWNNMLAQIRFGVENEHQNPHWVHGVCSKAYPYIFKMVSYDDNDSFILNTDCSAGLLSMIVVCARSTALAGREESDADKWVTLPRVVAEEGESADDVAHPMDFRTCRELCDANAECKSLAHGPYGCHLKKKCVNADTPLAREHLFEDMPEAEIYKTHYRKDDPDCAPKDRGALGNENRYLVGEHETTAVTRIPFGLPNVSGRNEKPESKRYDSLPESKKEELANLMLFTIRTGEFCLHCLDDSNWPFTLREINENYSLFLEDRERFTWKRADHGLGTGIRPLVHVDSGEAGMHSGSTDAEAVAAGIYSLQEARDSGENAVEAVLDLRHKWALQKFQIRWTRAIDSEVGFWYGRLSPDPETNLRIDSRARLQEWLQSGAAPWAYDDMCMYIENCGSRRNRTSLHILNAGSGPFAPKQLTCKDLSWPDGDFSRLLKTSPIRLKQTRDQAGTVCVSGTEEGYGGGGLQDGGAAKKCKSVEEFQSIFDDDGAAGGNVDDTGSPSDAGSSWGSMGSALLASMTGGDTSPDDVNALREDTAGSESKAAIRSPTAKGISVRTEQEATLSELTIPITSADGLGKYYLQLYDGFDMVPPTNLPVNCHVEKLSECFPVNYFDITHMRNALDHVFNPLIGIHEMLHVTRPRGYVLLRHAQNEGVPGEFRVGLHQWAFDVDVREYVTRPVVGFPSPQRVGRGHFVIWNPELRLDVTEYLLSHNLVSEIVADLVPHPSGNAAPEEKFVWVDIVK
ncbi:unnamed protein product [Amoebophrya sp. A25]|nr:unnamed protein product [Amoebophrya sp. A25]|eukprot:GSA25T00005215001.1